jgi:hypothetical protein
MRLRPAAWYSNAHSKRVETWERKNAQKPAVANMSLGGGRSRSLNAAVRNSAASGVF